MVGLSVAILNEMVRIGHTVEEMCVQKLEGAENAM